MTPRIPSNCPKCGIGDFIFGTFVTMDEESMYCHICTELTILEDEEEETELTASLTVCPHCRATNTFAIFGSDVWCEGCGLDPDEDVESEEIAFLWTAGSQIRNLLANGRAQPRSKVGTFLRASCGPKCEFSKVCPQATANLVKCYKEERLDPDGSEMSKKSKKARKRQQKQSRILGPQRKPRGLVACSGIGWFRRQWSDREITNYGVKNNSSQQSRDTER